MARDRIVRLGKDTAIKAIENCKTVMYRHGVWNPYKERSVDDVKLSIRCSGYGADVYFDDESGVYYVSIPCDSDMW